MSYIKFSSDLYLDSKELNKWSKFIDEEGFRKLFLQSLYTPGIVYNAKDGVFDNFKVEQGTNLNTIKHASGIAVNKDGVFIVKEAKDNISIPADDNWYWIKIKHKYSPEEVGTVSIDASGNLTGVNTKFTEVLRGFPGLASKVRFEGASLNTGEYDVLEVISDTNAVLQGDLQAESNLKLVIVGTFTPDATPPQTDKDIFQYDSCELSVEEEIGLNSPPDLIDGEEFLISRVKNQGGNFTIQDVRGRYLMQLRSDYERENVSTVVNNLIGIESIKYDHPFATKDKNLVQVGWGLRSDNWTYDPSNNLITVNSGEGGKLKGTYLFSDGDFNGWRLYYEDKYAIIRNSTKNGTQINLSLDTVDYLELDSTDEIRVVPNVEGIVIKFEPVTFNYTEKAEKQFYFPINQAFAKIPVLVYEAPTCNYSVKYQYKNGKSYSDFVLITNDTIGYYNEESFDENGSLKPAIDRTRVPYVSSITLTMAEDSYSTLINQVISGDNFGVKKTQLNNGSPLISLKPGINAKNQIIDHSSSGITLTVDHYIDLVSKDASGNVIANDGNVFNLQFLGTITLDGNSLKVVTGYINPGDPGTEVLDIDQDFLDRATDNDARVEFTYDLETDSWNVYEYNVQQSGLPPGGSAGGDLTGTYPNPTIGANKVVTAKINDGAVTSGKIGSNAVITAKINDGAVTNAKIGNNEVTEAKIANDSISSTKYQDGSVTVDKLANNAVSTAKIQGNAVTNDKMANDSVGTSELIDDSVTKDKIAASEGWTSMTVTANMVANAGTPFQYRVDNLGHKQLRGSGYIDANAKSGDVFTTLPVGYRPTSLVTVIGFYSNGGYTASGNASFLQITTDGKIKKIGSTPDGTGLPIGTDFQFSFDGLIFD